MPAPPPVQPPKRHLLRSVLIIAGCAVVAFVVALVAVGAAVGGSNKPSKQAGVSSAVTPYTPPPGVPRSSAPPPAPTLTRAERSFVSDMRSTFNWDSGTTDATIASIGDMVCAARVGSSQSSVRTQVAGQVFGGGAGQITKLAERDMCRKYLPPPPKPKVVARFSGEGIQNTGPFTVPASWHLSWEYWGCSGGEGNFIVDENNTDGSTDFNGVSVNELGSGRGPVATDAYGDAGRHYFQVNSECSWSLAVVVGGH